MAVAVVAPHVLPLLGPTRNDRNLAKAARTRVNQLLTSDALYTAAVVHAVLGDHGLAATYTTKYLAGGGLPAEFGYPLFDHLRHDPALGQQLTARSCEFPAP